MISSVVHVLHACVISSESWQVGFITPGYCPALMAQPRVSGAKWGARREDNSPFGPRIELSLQSCLCFPIPAWGILTELCNGFDGKSCVRLFQRWCQNETWKNCNDTSNDH